jgi:predicted MFS family arabinose efflux permease
VSRLLTEESTMARLRERFDLSIWTGPLVIFAIATFLDAFGWGLQGGTRMNFFVETLGLSGDQVLWLEGIREIPGLILILVAALTMRLPLTRQAALSVFITGVGFMLYAFVGSFTGILGAALVASFGFHTWVPLKGSIGMTLAGQERAGRVMGSLNAVTALASIAGMGAVALISRLFESMSLGTYYLASGGAIVIASFFLLALPKHIGATDVAPPRILLKRRYWLYYLLIFFAGARKLVLSSFITLVLVENYGLRVWQVSTLTLVSSSLTFILAPYLGALIDRYGEQVMTPISYAVMALCCLGYAFVDSLWVLILLWILIKLATPLSIGLSTYVYRSAPPEELTPTLSAGVTFDHITSLGMPFAFGALLPVIDYGGVFLGSGVLILLSIPFARALQTRMPEKTEEAGAAVAVAD